MVLTTRADYVQFYCKNILKFAANRFFPYLGVSLVGILIANKNFEEFSFFSYISSAFIFSATVATFAFLAIGNLTSSDSKSQRGEIFISIFILAITAAAIVVLICITILQLSAVEIESYPSSYKARKMAEWYVVYIFVYVLTSFFNCYFEAWVDESVSNIGRVVGFVPLVLLGVVGFLLHDELNYSYVIVLLMVVCSVLELIYYIYVACKKKLFSLKYNIRIMRALIVIGVPQGIGLASQRFAFFIVNKHLLLVDKEFVSLFSAAVSIVSLLAIPVSAFTQIHSIHVARNRGEGFNKLPVLLLLASALPSIVLITCFDYLILPLYGLRPDLLDNDRWVSTGIFMMLLSTCPLMLVTAHLRAYGQSFAPQVIINAAVYGIYVGTVSSGLLDNQPLSYLLFTYAITFFICLAVLLLRERLNPLDLGIPKHINRGSR